MRVALAVNRIGPDREANMQQILRLTAEAAAAGASLVLFPETAVTGLINNDDPAHDLPLGVPVPGELTGRLAEAARSGSIWLGIGLFEWEQGRLYDSAILLDPEGQVRLHYRRTNPGWHAPDADPAVYGEGTDYPRAETPLGRIMCLICGDLFHDEQVEAVRAGRPDLLLYPFARAMEGEWSQVRWEREEMGAYAERVRLTGATALMVNYLSDLDGSCGGAWVVRPGGTVSHSLPLGRSGLLLADL